MSHINPADLELPVAALFEHGFGQHQQGLIQEATACYEGVLRKDPTHFDAMHLLGVIALHQGDYNEALQRIGRAIALNPNVAHAYCNQGVAWSAVNALEQAVESFGKAVELDPNFVVALYNQAIALAALNRHEAALAAYDRVVALDPTHESAWSDRGELLHRLGRRTEACTSYDKAIALRSQDADLYYRRGLLQAELNLLDAARASYDMAIACRPNFVEAICNRAGILSKLQRFEDAVAGYDRAIQIAPDYALAHSNRGNALRAWGRLEDALDSYDRAIALDANYASALVNRGNVLHSLGRSEEALQSLDRGVHLRPNDADAQYNRANLLSEIGRVQGALAGYKAALALRPNDPVISLNMSHELLRDGQLQAGWTLYEMRWGAAAGVGAKRLYLQPRWNGSQSLQGKTILLYPEQGLGDVIHFCRYATLLAARGANVVLEVPPPLVSTLRRLQGVHLVVPSGEPLPAFDFHCPLMSVPLAFGTTLDTIPRDTAYLHADPAKVEHWARVLGPRKEPRIGLVWSSMSPFKGDATRSMALSTFVAALPKRGFRYVCLQKEVKSVDQVALQARPDIECVGDSLHDFSDTAALIANLDLVVSTCTSTPHLAAAMGKPTWLALQYVPDWRWLTERSDSPWYPSVRLYRQTRRGDWSCVLERIRHDLELLAPAAH